MIHIDKRRFGLDGVGRNEATFDKLVGRLLVQLPVFKCTWFMFACITDKIVVLHPMVEDLFPFDPGRKASAATPTEPGFLQFIDDLVCRLLLEKKKTRMQIAVT